MVLAITAIALTVGLIRIGGVSVGLSQGERVATALVADLRYAQSQAIASAKNHYLLFTSNGSKYVSYAIYRVETGGDVQVEPTRVVADSAAITGASNRAEFQPNGTAILDYTYTVTSPGRTFTVSVQALWGNVSLTRQ